MNKLREHSITLFGDRVCLRPITEKDWGVLCKWNSDPEVLYFCEGDDVAGYSVEDVKAIYRSVSQKAFCFIIEFENQPIGECWLQKMNLPRLQDAFPDSDCRRIDLMIGEKTLWGKGIGTETIELLIKFGFEQENMDIVFGCDVADYNLASQRAFEKAGFEVYQINEQPPGAKAKQCYDFILTRDTYTVLSGKQS